MGFDNYFNQDHCYLEDCRNPNTDQIACNVEITDSSNRKEKCNISITKDSNKSIKPHIIIKSQGEIQNSRNSGNQQVIYLPLVEVCTEHQDLFLLEDEKLVKPGDKFKTHNDFVQYLNENAKRWFYYYKCYDSRKPNTGQESYLYTCVYLRNKEKYVKKGLRKRTNNLKTDCPCKIRLRHLPQENELTVVFVCNHHDHPLSEEEFHKLQHGRRLPPYIKEEIMDLIALQVDVAKIRKYVQIATGFNMGRPFFYGIERTMKIRNIQRQISDERIRMLSERISVVDEVLPCDDSVADVQEQTSLTGNTQIETFDPAHSIVQKTPGKRRKKVLNTAESKRSRANETIENETLESVRNLQESVKCETQHNPWITDQCVPVLSDGSVGITHLNDIILKGDNKEYEDHNIEIIFPNSIETDQQIITRCSDNGSIENRDEIESNLGDSCIAYETVVTEIDNDNVYDDTVISEYVYSDHVYNDNEIDINNDTDVTNYENAIQADETINHVNNDTDIEYLTDNGNNEVIHNDNGDDNIEADEVIVEYNVCDNFDVGDDSTKINAKDVEVQTCDSKQSPLLSVFDVCMKDGHVTGFIVNDGVMNQLKSDRVDKAVQTEDINNSETRLGDIALNLEDSKSDSYIEEVPDGSHITHEYIHKYNIDKYMRQPCFPKYIELLSKKIHIDVLQMFTNVYSDQAMFKMTTTQNGKEGSTRILYVTDPPKDIAQNIDMKERGELSKNLNEVLILKEKIRELELKNSELETKNKHLMSTS